MSVVPLLGKQAGAAPSSSATTRRATAATRYATLCGGGARLVVLGLDGGARLRDATEATGCRPPTGPGPGPGTEALRSRRGEEEEKKGAALLCRSAPCLVPVCAPPGRLG